MNKDISNGWHQSKADFFWAEQAHADHVVQVYDNDKILIDALTEFVIGGFKAGDSSIIIATDIHLSSLTDRIKNSGFKLELLQAQNRFIALDVSVVLSKFMVNDWPDETLFFKTISDIVEKIGVTGRIRAFGEMVAILWERELHGATIHLEHLWDKFFTQHPLCLFCAYPKKAFAENYESSVQHICRMHSKLIEGCENEPNDIMYKNIPAE